MGPDKHVAPRLVVQPIQISLGMKLRIYELLQSEILTDNCIPSKILQNHFPIKRMFHKSPITNQDNS